MTDLPIEYLEKLEKKYDVKIHVVTNISKGINKYYYKKYELEEWKYISDDINKLELFFKDILLRGK